MTRLLSGRTARLCRGRFDLEEAFKFIGKGASFKQLEWAADLLHDSGLDALEYDDQLVAIAEKNGSSGIAALDLVVAFHHGVEALYRGPGLDE